VNTARCPGVGDPAQEGIVAHVQASQRRRPRAATSGRQGTRARVKQADPWDRRAHANGPELEVGGRCAGGDGEGPMAVPPGFYRDSWSSGPETSWRPSAPDRSEVLGS